MNNTQLPFQSESCRFRSGIIEIIDFQTKRSDVHAPAQNHERHQQQPLDEELPEHPAAYAARTAAACNSLFPLPRGFPNQLSCASLLELATHHELVEADSQALVVAGRVLWCGGRHLRAVPRRPLRRISLARLHCHLRCWRVIPPVGESAGGAATPADVRMLRTGANGLREVVHGDTGMETKVPRSWRVAGTLTKMLAELEVSGVNESVIHELQGDSRNKGATSWPSTTSGRFFDLTKSDPDDGSCGVMTRCGCLLDSLKDT